jgi:2-oxoisovalerate dehydrogenase E1 component
VIQNNRYGISVPVRQQSANTRVSDNYVGLKYLKIINVDGTDFFDSWQGMQDAIAYVRSGEGPAMVHADCVRIGSHSNSDRQEMYRDETELAEVRLKDPMVRFRGQLLEWGLFQESELAEIEARARVDVDAACARGEAAPEADASS